jgi:glycosyltransferase involved in cell wall biosynthesis
LASINGFIKRVPIIILEETSDPKNRSWRANLLMKIFIGISDKIIGVSPGVVDYLENQINIKHKKIELINNGVAIPNDISEKDKKELKNKFGIKDDEIVIGSVGRMLDDNHKRFSDLINSFEKLIQKGFKVKLILVGEGPEKAKYQKLTKELQIEDKVIFTGYQSKINEFYAIFDIFSLVSAYEAFGLVLAEAMLHKLPIVATRVGGMQHIVENDKTGFLVEKFDILKIAEKLEILCLEPDLRTLFAKNGFDKAMENYTEVIYVKNIEKLYNSLLDKKNNKLYQINSKKND